MARRRGSPSTVKKKACEIAAAASQPTSSVATFNITAANVGVVGVLNVKNVNEDNEETRDG